MPHHTPLLTTIVAGLTLAFTRDFVGDQALTLELAEIGVILLMFGVGLHFTISGLMSVSEIAIPGAAAQLPSQRCSALGLRASWVGR
jgi:monovalent cation:H+ antiporter-2, CPA2 family